MTLSLLMVTAGEPYARGYVDAFTLLAKQLEAELVIYDGAGAGAIEYVLEDALARCSGDYVFRLDDDELASPALRTWLLERRYEAARHWSFPRAHLYPDADHVVTSSPLWPDIQTRLSVPELAGGRTSLHVSSPYGVGQVAPAAIEHYKFLIRSLDERRELVYRYEVLQQGAGSGFRVFSVPEEFEVEVIPYDRQAVAA